MNNDLVSIIIPVYNTEKFIEECLLSVIRQSYSNLEIIVINDGSSDRSAAICCKYAERDSRIVFIDRDNYGLSYTRQQGIDIAHGKYFCTLDSDDLYDINFVSRMLDSIKTQDADICVCGRTDFDEHYKEEYLLNNTKIRYELTKDWVSNDIHNLAQKLWLADSWNKMYRTKFVHESHVRFFMDNRFNGTDLSFNHLLALHCPCVCICNEPLLLHRIVLGSRVHKKNKPLQEGFEIIADRVFKEAEKLGYSKRFFNNYGVLYYRLLGMVFSAILDESNTFREAFSRAKEYYGRKDMFCEIYPFLKDISIGNNSSAYMRLYYMCLFRNSHLSFLALYELSKIRKLLRGRKKKHG